MKVTLLHGQNYRQPSWHAAHLLLEQLPVEALHEFYLPKDMPYLCCGCYRCMELGEDFCPHTAYMAPTTRVTKGANLLIFTIPAYCLRTSGSVKTFLDHCFLNFVVYRPLPSMYHEQAVVLVSGAGSGMKETTKDIRASLTGWEISHISSYGFRSAATMWGAIPESTRRRLTTDLAKPTSRIKQKQYHRRISWKQKLLFHTMWQIQRHGMEADELDYQYRKERGWLGRSRPWTDDEQNTYIHFRRITCIRLLLYTVWQKSILFVSFSCLCCRASLLQRVSDKRYIVFLQYHPV